MPIITAVYISHNISGYTTVLRLPANTTDYIFNDLPQGLYEVFVLFENIVGNGSYTSGYIIS